MLLGLILGAGLCILGVGYVYRSIQQEEIFSHEQEEEQLSQLPELDELPVEGEVGKMLDELVTHLQLYEHYFEGKV